MIKIIFAIFLFFQLSDASRLVTVVNGSDSLNVALGVVSTTNSTNSPLGGGAVFTGTSEQIKDYSTITVFYDTDQDGSIAMQFSSDGTNWDREKVVPIKQEIASGNVHTLETVAQYFRIVYTNGSVAQTHFRLQTVYHTQRSGFLTSSPDQKISKINDAQIVRVSNDPNFDISRGLYADKYGFHRFGHNSAAPNGSFADVWSYGPTDPSYNWPTTAEGFRIKAGGNSADTTDGLGARSIQIIYLDSNGDQQQEQITTAGSVASDSTSAKATRLIRAWVDATGTILSNNTGNILIENVTSGQIVGVISAGAGQTQMSQYTVPKNYTCYLSRITVDVASGANKDADVRLWQRTQGLTFSAPFGVKRDVRDWDGLQGESDITFEHLPAFSQFTDLWFEAKGNGAVTEVDVDYDLICVKDEAPTSPQ